MLGTIVFVFAVWTACGLLGGYAAAQKHRGPVEGFALGFLFGPLVTLIAVLLPTLPEQPITTRSSRTSASATRTRTRTRLEGWQPPVEERAKVEDPSELWAFDAVTNPRRSVHRN